MSDLAKRDYVLCIDRSGSMGEPVKKGGSQSRWDAIKEYTMSFVRKCCELDDDGIDVYFFNATFSHYANVTPEKVMDIFEKTSPTGGTDFVPVLTDALNGFFKASKPRTIIVVTDGEPSDITTGREALTRLIINTTKKIEGDSELGIEFIQIGDCPGARQFLKTLDDDLTSKGAKFDIVNSITCDELNTKTIEEVLLAAVNE